MVFFSWKFQRQNKKLLHFLSFFFLFYKSPNNGQQLLGQCSNDGDYLMIMIISLNILNTDGYKNISLAVMAILNNNNNNGPSRLIFRLVSFLCYQWFFSKKTKINFNDYLFPSIHRNTLWCSFSWAVYRWLGFRFYYLVVVVVNNLLLVVVVWFLGKKIKTKQEPKRSAIEV